MFVVSASTGKIICQATIDNTIPLKLVGTIPPLRCTQKSNEWDYWKSSRALDKKRQTAVMSFWHFSLSLHSSWIMNVMPEVGAVIL